MTQDQYRQILITRMCMDTILESLKCDLPDKDWQEEKILKKIDEKEVLWKSQR